jgi:hypothetical protein
MHPGDNCWKDWAIRLRMKLMRNKLSEVILPVQEIKDQVGFGGTLEELQSFGYWNACRNHIEAWDTLFKQGIEVDFSTNNLGRVDEVTFRLDESWRSLMEGR